MILFSNYLYENLRFIIYNFSLFVLADINTNFKPHNKRKKKESVNLCQKNPVSILNELKPGIKYYTIEQSGPAHSPVFKVAVDVDGQKYIGIGGSKKNAKYKAAGLALQSFIQFPTILISGCTDSANTDFTADSFELNDKKPVANNHAVQTVKEDVVNQNKSAVMLLNELYPGTKYEWFENGGDVYARFKVTVIVGEEKFIGTGT